MWAMHKLTALWRAQPGDLGAECEAFLSGSYQSYLMGRSSPVPAWAWINPLAHGDRAQVERIARMADNGSDAQALTACLARKMLRSIDAGVGTLRELQRRTLIPLELALTRQTPELDVPETSAHLTAAIAAAVASGLSPLPRCQRSNL